MSHISQLIKFRSIEGSDDEIAGALEFVLDRAREMGFDVRKTSTEDVGVIDLGAGEETLEYLFMWMWSVSVILISGCKTLLMRR